MSTRLNFRTCNKTIFDPLPKYNEEFNQPGQLLVIQIISSTAKKSFHLLPKKSYR